MHRAQRCSTGTATGVCQHQGAAAMLRRSPAEDVIQVHHACPSETVGAGPWQGSTPKPPTPLFIPHNPRWEVRAGQGFQGHQGFWECGTGSVSARALILTEKLITFWSSRGLVCCGAGVCSPEYRWCSIVWLRRLFRNERETNLPIVGLAPTRSYLRVLFSWADRKRGKQLDKTVWKQV